MIKTREERKARKAKSVARTHNIKHQTEPAQNEKEEMISAYNKAAGRDTIKTPTPKPETERKRPATPKKEENPDSRIKKCSSDDLEFNPTTSLKPPSRLVLGKYPHGIKSKYMEDYAQNRETYQFDKLVRKSFLYHPFSHPLEGKTSKNVGFFYTRLIFRESRK